MSIQIEQAKSLAMLTTLKVGGSADYFVEVNSDKQLKEAVSYAKHNCLTINIISGGSNVLVCDEGIPGLIMHVCMKGFSYEQKGSFIFLTASAGEHLDDIVSHTVSQGWWGLENLSHIPGTIGATPVQNVGAYGVEIKDVISLVHVFDTEDGVFKELTVPQCQFGYRDSLFKKTEGKKYIVTAVTYKLSILPKPKLSYRDLIERFESNTPALLEIRNAIIEIRSSKFPDYNTVGTAGSFFKNPVISKEKFKELLVLYPELPGFSTEDGLVKISLGWVLDKVLSMKGVRDGRVGTYKDQALVLINYGNASSNEIEIFANSIVKKVKDIIDVSIEWEVTKL